MTLMEHIQRGKVAAPRRVMLYGTPGIGKSQFAAHSDRPIFIQTEDGLGQIDCEKFPPAQSVDDVIRALSELYTAEHNYRTVVVDTLDWLERLIWAEVCRRKMVESIEDIGYAHPEGDGDPLCRGAQWPHGRVVGGDVLL
jgi:replication-associated recombination protein RarA